MNVLPTLRVYNFLKMEQKGTKHCTFKLSHPREEFYDEVL